MLCLGRSVRAEKQWGIVVELSEGGGRGKVLRARGRIDEVAHRDLEKAVGAGAVPSEVTHLWYSHAYKHMCRLLCTTGAAISKELLMFRYEMLAEVVALPKHLTLRPKGGGRAPLYGYIQASSVVSQIRLPTFGRLLECLKEEYAAAKIQAAARGWHVRRHPVAPKVTGRSKSFLRLKKRIEQSLKGAEQKHGIRALAAWKQHLEGKATGPGGEGTSRRRAVSPSRPRARLWFWETVPGAAQKDALDELKYALAEAFHAHGLGTARDRKKRDRLLRKKSKVDRRGTRRLGGAGRPGMLLSVPSGSERRASVETYCTGSPSASSAGSPRDASPTYGMKRKSSSLAAALASYMQKECEQTAGQGQAVFLNAPNDGGAHPPAAAGSAGTTVVPGIVRSPEGTRRLDTNFEIPVISLDEAGGDEMEESKTGSGFGFAAKRHSTGTHDNEPASPHAASRMSVSRMSVSGFNASSSVEGKDGEIDPERIADLVIDTLLKDTTSTSSMHLKLRLGMLGPGIDDSLREINDSTAAERARNASTTPRSGAPHAQVTPTKSGEKKVRTVSPMPAVPRLLSAFSATAVESSVGDVDLTEGASGVHHEDVADMTLEEYILHIRDRNSKGRKTKKRRPLFPTEAYLDSSAVAEASWSGLDVVQYSPRISPPSRRVRLSPSPKRDGNASPRLLAPSCSPKAGSETSLGTPRAAGPKQHSPRAATGKVASGQRTGATLRNHVRLTKRSATYTPSLSASMSALCLEGHLEKAASESSASSVDSEDPADRFLEFEEELLYAAAVGHPIDFSRATHTFDRSCVAAWPVKDSISKWDIEACDGSKLKFSPAPSPARSNKAEPMPPPVLVHRF
eukprot:TRINITY_DN8856_c0_g1_i1.p1 TRINITY_DN8856_c0_g1~~TRINITY_DN8856_c0_g1_i1.p1  ORF type:complete len:853 (+),score=283.66 TRINITY_DN8856_c0_g1_i1:137-2695(+)